MGSHVARPGHRILTYPRWRMLADGSAFVPPARWRSNGSTPPSTCPPLRPTPGELGEGTGHVAGGYWPLPQRLYGNPVRPCLGRCPLVGSPSSRRTFSRAVKRERSAFFSFFQKRKKGVKKGKKTLQRNKENSQKEKKKKNS